MEAAWWFTAGICSNMGEGLAAIHEDRKIICSNDNKVRFGIMQYNTDSNRIEMKPNSEYDLNIHAFGIGIQASA